MPSITLTEPTLRELAQATKPWADPTPVPPNPGGPGTPPPPLPPAPPGVIALQWVNPQFFNTAGLTAKDTLIAQFTTDAAVNANTSGQMTLTGWKDGDYARLARLCYDVAGTVPVMTAPNMFHPNGQPATAQGNSPGIQFGPGVIVMKPNTTYYYIVTTTFTAGQPPPDTPVNVQLQLSHS